MQKKWKDCTHTKLLLHLLHSLNLLRSPLLLHYPLNLLHSPLLLHYPLNLLHSPLLLHAPLHLLLPIVPLLQMMHQLDWYNA